MPGPQTALALTSTAAKLYGPRMRKALIALGAAGALLGSFVATSHCCERLNFLATLGLAKPG